jgi:hypothetical protein
MTQKGSDSENRAPEEAETRVLSTDEQATEEQAAEVADPDLAETVVALLEDEPELNAAAESERASQTSSQEASDEDSDDDRTQLVTHVEGGSGGGSLELDATRVLDPGAPPAISDHQASTEAATRVLDPSDNKTSLPPVSAEAQQSHPSSPAFPSAPPPRRP